jgi:hypothetical protein
MRPQSVLFFLAALLWIKPAAMAQNISAAGTVALSEGKVQTKVGSIDFLNPKIGEHVRVNSFGQYRDDAPLAAKVTWRAREIFPLRSGQEIKEGMIIETLHDGFAKILLNNETVVDIGPETILKIQKFTIGQPEADVCCETRQPTIKMSVQPTIDCSNQTVSTPKATRVCWCAGRFECWSLKSNRSVEYPV